MNKLVTLIATGSVLCSASLFAARPLPQPDPLDAAPTNTTTVNWGAQISNGLGLANGTPLANGSNDLILLGNFNISNAMIIANGSNLAFLQSHFTTFGSAVIGAGNPGGPGSASDGYFTGVSTASASGLSLASTQMFYWVFNAPTAGAATQQGIFTLGSNPNWTFPDDSATAQSKTNDLSQVLNPSGILWGSFGTGTSRDGLSPLYNLALIAVPEPSTLALIGFALVGAPVVFLRRRR